MLSRCWYSDFIIFPCVSLRFSLLRHVQQMHHTCPWGFNKSFTLTGAWFDRMFDMISDETNKDLILIWYARLIVTWPALLCVASLPHTVVSCPCLLIETSPAQRWPVGWQQTALTYTKENFQMTCNKNQMYFSVFAVPSAAAGNTGKNVKTQHGVSNWVINEESTFTWVSFLFRSLQIFIRYLHVMLPPMSCLWDQETHDVLDVRAVCLRWVLDES